MFMSALFYPSVLIVAGIAAIVLGLSLVYRHDQWTGLACMFIGGVVFITGSIISVPGLSQLWCGNMMQWGPILP